MAFGPGEWVELVRAVPARRGANAARSRAPGFLGGLDFELENGERVRGVDRAPWCPSGPSGPAGPSSGTGGRLLGTALAVLAVLVWLQWGR